MWNESHMPLKTLKIDIPLKGPTTGSYLGSLGMCSDRLVSRTAIVKPMSLAGLWNLSVNSLKSTLPSWLASTHIMMYSISSLNHNHKPTLDKKTKTFRQWFFNFFNFLSIQLILVFPRHINIYLCLIIFTKSWREIGTTIYYNHGKVPSETIECYPAIANVTKAICYL